MANVAPFLVEVSIWALPTIFAIILHEVMHGVVARMLGDDTAQRAGRLTLNPIAHVDLFGTIILPAILLFAHLPVFGYAKPVPIDYRNLRSPRTGMMIVAAAGPLTNVALAIVSAIALRATMQLMSGQSIAALWLRETLTASVVINIVLGVFNLFPLLPLDGGRVLAGMLPYPAARAFARMERFGFLILFLLLYTNAFERMISPVINAIARVLL